MISSSAGHGHEPGLDSSRDSQHALDSVATAPNPRPQEAQHRQEGTEKAAEVDHDNAAPAPLSKTDAPQGQSQPQGPDAQGQSSARTPPPLRIHNGAEPASLQGSDTSTEPRPQAIAVPSPVVASPLTAPTYSPITPAGEPSTLSNPDRMSLDNVPERPTNPKDTPNEMPNDIAPVASSANPAGETTSASIPPQTPLHQIRPSREPVTLPNPSDQMAHLSSVAGDVGSQSAMSHALASFSQGHLGDDLAGWHDRLPDNFLLPYGSSRHLPTTQPGAMSPPSIVTPAQVQLPRFMDEEPAPPIALAPAATLQRGAKCALESFARIEFPDSVFQMTTYAVVIGRDQRAVQQARRDGQRAEEHRRKVEDHQKRGIPPPLPMTQDRAKFSKSYISEEGGMLGPESDDDWDENDERPRKRRKKTVSAGPVPGAEDQIDIISERIYVGHTPGAAAVDLAALRPTPYHTPFLGIHSSGPDMAAKTKAISREHLKIKYNEAEGIFEAIPLHTNGFFHEDKHVHTGKRVLRCGDQLQIKDVAFRFMINGVPKGSTGSDMADDHYGRRHVRGGGKQMSFEFEGSHGDQEVQDTSDELSEMADSPQAPSEMGDYRTPNGTGVAAHDQMVLDPPGVSGALMMNPEDGLMQFAGQPIIPKKRGPGRPPKNGIMSKREQRLLKKAEQEAAKQNLPPLPPVEPPVKRKVGRPRKHPLPEDAGDRPEKRKYTPRKSRDEIAEGSDAERQAKEVKERKARAKSPPLQLKKEDYTEEQLMKPSKNYGVLIDEVLTEAGPDGLSLKQIYKRLSLRYPYFYFFPETKGWESSVRHNLLGNKAFDKIQGGFWYRVPGIELDAGKKRKTSPARRVSYSPHGAYAYPPYNNAQSMPPVAPGYPMNQAPSAYQQAAYASQQPRPIHQGQHYPPASSSGPPQQQPVAAQAPAAAQGQHPTYPPPHPQAAARPQFSVPQSGGTYAAQYTQPPNQGATAPAIKGEEGVPVPLPGPPVSQAVAPPHNAPVAGTSSSPQPSMVAANGPNATPPATNAPRPVIEPRLLSALNNLKKAMTDQLKTSNPNAEALVMSALNRFVGLKTGGDEVDKVEAVCVRGMKQLLDGFNKGRSPTPGHQGTAAAPPSIFGAGVLESINGFKNVSIKALAPKIGETRAVDSALSAIDRVLGFADKSVMPKPADTLEGVEQHMMRAIRRLLIGMNQKLHPSA